MHPSALYSSERLVPEARAAIRAAMNKCSNHPTLSLRSTGHPTFTDALLSFAAFHTQSRTARRLTWAIWNRHSSRLRMSLPA
jgi:hypothetical protein